MPTPSASDLSGHVPVRYGGHNYLVGPPATWMHGARDALAAGQLVQAMALILGDEQHSAFRATKPTLGDVSALLAEIGATFGASAIAGIAPRHLARDRRTRRGIRKGGVR